MSHLHGKEEFFDTELVSPSDLKKILYLPKEDLQFIEHARAAISNALNGISDRLLVIVGPCSIHDTAAALQYAEYLSLLRGRLSRDLEIVMRVYFEKPRTRLGWKGLINDPHLDETCDIAAGLHTARKLLLDIAAIGLPVATEFLDVTSHHYLSDLVSWGAIGARTTESQIHREMASGLPCPIGFKNGTDGSIKVAVDAILASSRPHHFLGIAQDGRYVRRRTPGNQSGHLVLRGGPTPNYDEQSVATACSMLSANGLTPRVVVDASHGNSGKQHENQLSVCDELSSRIARGDAQIAGIMIESNLVAGSQTLKPGKALVYGQSVTDSCIGWQETSLILQRLAFDVRRRRKLLAGASQPLQVQFG
ncbi:3-deoxy-7-phosphoheptulonate synthase [Burkholderia sp. LMG 32019]|uniref:3-deoxy-7-phosphoheptulonate synthase n=1 Tax=Burkholderia sp. LMG 32019 TaxID=3158173 RepID=UPI003C2F3FB9